MGSKSDWKTLERAATTLSELGVPHECEVVSAHRTPEKLADYARTAVERGLKVIIAGAGGAAYRRGSHQNRHSGWTDPRPRHGGLRRRPRHAAFFGPQPVSLRSASRWPRHDCRMAGALRRRVFKAEGLIVF